MLPAPRPHTEASKQQSTASSRQGDAITTERPPKQFDSDFAALVADRFVAERHSFYRSCALFLYPLGDNIWNRIAPQYASDFELARNRTCEAITELEQAVTGYQQSKKEGKSPDAAALLDAVELRMGSLVPAIRVAHAAHLGISRDMASLADGDSPQLVMGNGTVLSPETIAQGSAAREERTRRMFNGIEAWASSFRPGLLDYSVPDITNMNEIVHRFCAGRYAVEPASGGHYVRVEPEAAEFLISSIAGHFVQSASRSLGKVIDATLADPKFWTLGDRDFASSPQARTLRDSLLFAPETRISVEPPSHIVVRLEVPELLRDAMRSEQSWLEHEVAVLERFANTKGVGFEPNLAVDQGHVEVRLLFHRLSKLDVEGRTLGVPPSLPPEGSPIAIDMPPIEEQTVSFQRTVMGANGEKLTPVISLPAQALSSSRARYTIAAMLEGIDDAVRAFPEISHALIQSESGKSTSETAEFSGAKASAYLTGPRGNPQFNPATTSYSELWSDYPWENDAGKAAPRSAGKTPEEADSDLLMVHADANTLLWHRDLWKRALDLRTRCNLMYLDLGPLPAGDPQADPFPANRVPNQLLESLEAKLDILKEEFGKTGVYVTISPLDLGRRYAEHFTHVVQLGAEGGVFARGIFDAHAGSLLLAPHSEVDVRAAQTAVTTALAALPDEKRHSVLAVAEALTNSSIRFHEQIALELVHAVPPVKIDAAEYARITAAVVERFLSGSITSVQIDDGSMYLRFLGEIS